MTIQGGVRVQASEPPGEAHIFLALSLLYGTYGAGSSADMDGHPWRAAAIVVIAGTGSSSRASTPSGSAVLPTCLSRACCGSVGIDVYIHSASLRMRPTVQGPGAGEEQAAQQAAQWPRGCAVVGTELDGCRHGRQWHPESIAGAAL